MLTYVKALKIRMKVAVVIEYKQQTIDIVNILQWKSKELDCLRFSECQFFYVLC